MIKRGASDHETHRVVRVKVRFGRDVSKRQAHVCKVTLAKLHRSAR